MTRAVVLCPGRGSYTEESLGSLDPDHELVRAAERLRADAGLESLVELDRAERFRPARHLRPANVSALIYVRTLLDVERVRGVVAVGGNSMGWYTALAAAGALSFEDGFRLVQRMALLQEEHADGGQVVYPVVDGEWQPDPEARAAVERDLDEEGVFASIELGGYRVLAGTPAGVSLLLESLPQVRLGKVVYPLRLAQHGPYHTELARPVALRARAELGGLAFTRPRATLIDGRGRMHTPWSADASELARYTFEDQVVRPYDFTSTVRVALRELAPDRLVLPGPGNTLGGVCGQVLVAEGWRGLRGRSAFVALQETEGRVVESMDRTRA